MNITTWCSQSSKKRALADPRVIVMDDIKKMKIFILLLAISIFFCGCGFGKYHNLACYVPQPTEGWHSVSNRIYQFKCGKESITVGPIVLSEREWANAFLWIPIPKNEHNELNKNSNEKSRTSVRFHRPFREGFCELNSFSLVNLSTGERILPLNVETRRYLDSSSQWLTLYCTYSYDINKNSNTLYKLYISDKELGCAVEPITYSFENVTIYQSAIPP